MDFIASSGKNKSIFGPPSRKQIACDTRKTLILLLWLLLSLFSCIKLQTRKINFLFSSRTIYYCPILIKFTLFAALSISFILVSLVPSRVFGTFVLLTNEQNIGPPLPGSLHQKVLGFLPSPEVEPQELQFLPLNLRSSALNIGQEPPPKYGRHLFRPYLCKSGTEGEPCTPWPRATRPHTSRRHPSCLVASSRATHGHIPCT